MGLLLGPAFFDGRPIFLRIQSGLIPAFATIGVQRAISRLMCSVNSAGVLPTEFSEHIKREIARWTPIVAKAGIKPD